MKKKKAMKMKAEPRKKPTHGASSWKSDGPLQGEMHLHVAERPDVAFAAPICISEAIRVSRVGHTFGLAPYHPWTATKTYVVQDFLLDQSQTSGTDGRMAPLKNFDLTQTTCFTFTVFVRTSRNRIEVKLPPSGETVFMGFNVGRRYVNAISDVSDAYPAQSVFYSAAGGAPVFTYNSFFIGRNTNHWVQFRVNASVHPPFTFSHFRTTGVYPQRAFDPGTKSYRVHNNSLPFNLPGPGPVPYLVFSYQTTNPVDPGPFVFIP